MDFKFNASKTYTNTITQSVGPTTSTTSRSLVVTDTSYYIYIDGVNGNDTNNGTSPSDAVKTLARAYVIHQLGGKASLLCSPRRFLCQLVGSIDPLCSGSRAEPDR